MAEIHKLYRRHDRLLQHKQAVFDHLVGRWRDLFNISHDVLLYDLTSTYFEADPPFFSGLRRTNTAETSSRDLHRRPILAGAKLPQHREEVQSIVAPERDEDGVDVVMLGLSLPFRVIRGRRQQLVAKFHQFGAERNGAAVYIVKIFGTQAPGEYSAFVVSLKDLGGYIFALKEGIPRSGNHHDNPTRKSRGRYHEIAAVAYQVSRSEDGERRREGRRADRERGAVPRASSPAFLIFFCNAFSADENIGSDNHCDDAEQGFEANVFNGEYRSATQECCSAQLFAQYRDRHRRRGNQ